MKTTWLLRIRHVSNNPSEPALHAVTLSFTDDYPVPVAQNQEFIGLPFQYGYVANRVQVMKDEHPMAEPHAWKQTLQQNKAIELPTEEDYQSMVRQFETFGWVRTKIITD